jgi:hypothetical protein
MPHGQIDGESELNAIEKELIAAQKQADAYSKEHTMEALSKLNKDEVVVANTDRTDDNSKSKKSKDRELKDEKPEEIANKITKEEDNNTEESDKKPERDLSEL